MSDRPPEVPPSAEPPPTARPSSPHGAGGGTPPSADPPGPGPAEDTEPDAPVPSPADGEPPWAAPRRASGPAPRGGQAPPWAGGDRSGTARWAPPGTDLPAAAEDEASVLLTVRSPSGTQATTRVPADVPVNGLAPALGLSVSVANVSELEDGAGNRIPGRSTLAEAGITGAATVAVVPPDVSPPRPPAATAPPTPAPAPAPSAPGVGGRSGAALLAALGILLVAAVAFLLGGVVIGRRTTPAGPGPVAVDAARAWLGARPFTAKRAGVPPDLERRGAIDGTLQPLGLWHHGSQAGETFAVTVGSNTFGLTVVTNHGALAFPPTPGPLPFVVGQAPPAPPAAPAGGPDRLPDPVVRWATSVFGPKGSGTAALGVGLGGAPAAVANWSPSAGGVVYRVRVPLTDLAVGTPGGDYATAYQQLAQKLAADSAASGSAQAAAARAQAAAQAAAAAAGANPPLAAQAAAAAAAATTAQQQAQAAAATVATDQASLTRDPKPAASAVTAVAVYDVWMRAQSVVGWEPAGYGFRG